MMTTTSEAGVDSGVRYMYLDATSALVNNTRQKQTESHSQHEPSTLDNTISSQKNVRRKNQSLPYYHSRKTVTS